MGSIRQDRSIAGKRERDTQKAIMYAMSVLGSTRENMLCALWTIKKNKSSERGLSSHFQLAVAVKHNGPFTVELEIKAELGGGLWLMHICSNKSRGGNTD